MRRIAGFTLVELLVVVAVISVLAALLLPGLEGSLRSARTLACANSQRQMMLATGLYANDHNGWTYCADDFFYGLWPRSGFTDFLQKYRYLPGNAPRTLAKDPLFYCTQSSLQTGQGIAPHSFRCEYGGGYKGTFYCLNRSRVSFRNLTSPANTGALQTSATPFSRFILWGDGGSGLFWGGGYLIASCHDEDGMPCMVADGSLANVKPTRKFIWFYQGDGTPCYVGEASPYSLSSYIELRFASVRITG